MPHNPSPFAFSKESTDDPSFAAEKNDAQKAHQLQKVINPEMKKQAVVVGGVASKDKIAQSGKS